jgi:Ca2+-binding EF-hand superfamily protein
MSIEEVKAISAEADTDGDGFIDREEWNAVLAKTTTKKAIEDEEEVIALFALFDEDGSGEIDRDELRRMLAIMGLQPSSDAELDDIMTKATEGGATDEITFQQFKALHADLTNAST